MSDLVERLRDKWQHSEEDCDEAADEIERLRVALEDLQAHYDADMGYRRDRPEAPR